MKKLISRPIGQLAVLATFVCSQFVFAGLIRPDDPGKTVAPNTVSSYRAISNIAYTISNVTVDLIGNDIMVNFNSAIGVATVTITDSQGFTVYQSTVDTKNVAEVSMPVAGLDSGDYTVTVTSKTTSFVEIVSL